jgi:uncharacterized membrane protein
MAAGSRGPSDGDSRAAEKDDEEATPHRRVPAADPHPDQQTAEAAPSPSESAASSGGLESHDRGAGTGHGEGEDIPVPTLTVENISMAAEAVALVAERRLWYAPMPDPDTLRQYDELLPGSAERILRMAEVSVMTQHEVDSKLADAEIVSARWSLGLAYSLAVLAIGSAIGFFVAGNQVAGVAFLSMPVVLMVQAMFSDRNHGPDDRPTGQT